LANLLESRDSTFAVAVRGADGNIVSGGSAGFSATLTGMTVGREILAYIGAINAQANGTPPAQFYLTPTATGAAVVSTTGPQYTGPDALASVFQMVWVGKLTATASTVSLSYSMTLGGAQSWTANTRSTIVLLAL
jgi:hypothetical protein